MVHTTYSVTLLVLLLAKSVEQGGAVTVPVGGVAVLSCDMVYDLTKALVWLDEDRGVLSRLPNGELYDFPPFVDRVSLVDIVNLRIENVRLEDEGEYKCQQEGAVTNGTPQDLVVAYAPDPPTNMRLYITSAGLVASCEAGQSYTGSQRICLEYRQHGTSVSLQGPCRSAVEDGRIVEFKVSDLQPSYNVCCIASDAFGENATCQSTGPLIATRTQLPEWAIAVIIGGVILIVLFIIAIAVCCCRNHGEEGNVCNKIPCPCPFGKRGEANEGYKCPCLCGKRGNGGKKKEEEDGIEMEDRGHVAGQGNNQVDAGVDDGALSVSLQKKKKRPLKEDKEKAPGDCCNWFRTINNYYYTRQNSSEGTTTSGQGPYGAPVRSRDVGVERSNSRRDADTRAKYDRKPPSSRDQNKVEIVVKEPRQIEPGQNDAELRRLLLPTSDGASGGTSSHLPNETSTVALIHPPREEPTGARVTVPKQGPNTDPVGADATHAMWDEVFRHVRDGLPDLPSRQHLPSAIGITLGLSEKDINRIVEQNHSNKENMLFHIISFWHNDHPHISPLTLAEALIKCKCNDVAKKVEDCWMQFNKT